MRVRQSENLLTLDRVELVPTPYGTTIYFVVAPLAEKYRFPMVGSTAASVKLSDIKIQYF